MKRVIGYIFLGIIYIVGCTVTFGMWIIDKLIVLFIVAILIYVAIIFLGAILTAIW